MEKLKHFKRITPKEPPLLIIEQIRTLLDKGKLTPGEKLPAEADLQKVFQVSRSQVHDAITLLERHGVLEAKPQRGTYLRDFGKQILLALMENIIDCREETDPVGLMEVRILIEKTAAVKAAHSVTEEQMTYLKKLHRRFLNHQTNSETAIDDDLSFHYALLETAGNQTLKSQFCHLIPDIIFLARRIEETCGRKNQLTESCAEHEKILEALEAGDGDRAADALEHHLTRVLENSRKL